MYDSLLNLHSANISGAGATNGTAKFLGRNRTFRAWGRCSGDVTGAGATCTITLQESTTSAMGSPSAIGGSLVVTEQVGYVSATGPTPRPEVPSTVSPLPSLVFTTTKDYVQTIVTAAGTSPVFPGLSVTIEPIDAPILASGR